MKSLAEFINDSIIVKKSKDASRLYNRSRFGEMISDNRLKLDLLEAVFLLSEGKITLFSNNKEMILQDLIKLAAKKIPEFEIRYLIFKDLRKRGYLVRLNKDDSSIYKDIHFYIYKGRNESQNEKQYFISAFSERDVLDIEKTKSLIQVVGEKNAELWFAIVDEEGDITYYNVAALDLKGKIRRHSFSKGVGFLLENRVVLFDKKLTKNLFKKEFYGKPFEGGLQISLVEAMYLIEKDVLIIKKIGSKKELSMNEFMKIVRQIQPDIEARLMVFRDLKKRGLLVKTGFKFGAHFRAYTKNPDEIHAEYLVHVVNKGFISMWSEISRAVRLAHSVNKEILFARVDGDNVDYIKFGRLRP